MALILPILIIVACLGSSFIKIVPAAGLPGVQSLSYSIDEPVPVNQSCTVGSYAFDNDNATLGVYCNTDDIIKFAYDWTFIDLNLCIGNDNGSLRAAPEGNFSATCENCNITWSHVDLTPTTTTFTTIPHAWITTTVTSINTPRWDDLYLGCGGCRNREYQYSPASIDLNKVMENENGTIGCHMYQGTTMHAEPDRKIALATATATATATTAAIEAVASTTISMVTAI